ncbi:hypothetical protein P8Q88_10240 [Qipengyuania sp. XHP0207]|uniref:hypothetical protein n=1 Tax=Qipengyuania sp. XHP0207 TaxID=3038078 RepID=UPI00241CE994|nr:hypothetical protein [Qipengyuania sp. XHP0207]MDG5748557.1 hypothetical protein [Qipengyuania sp. XHP0207]
MIDRRKLLALASAAPLFLSACGELRSEEAESAVAEENEPRPGAKTVEQQFLEQEQERIGLTPEPVVTAPEVNPTERVELVVAGQDAPGREFTSVEACEKAKVALAKHDEEACDPRAVLCVPYQRTCVRLD